MVIVSYLLSAVDFVVGILVLIRLFKKEGVLKGILGIICMLYTFIWGWMHHKDENITTLMWVWTAIIIISIIVSGIVASTAASSVQSGAWLPLI
jgi:hypothetical protein